MSGIARELLTMRYNDTYSYVHMVFQTLVDEEGEYLQGLHEFFGLEDSYPSLIQPFPKWSLLHQYILFSIYRVESEEMPPSISPDFLEWHAAGLSEGMYPPTPIEQQLARHEIPHQNFLGWAAARGVELTEVNEDHFVEYYDTLGRFDAFDQRKFVEGPRGALYELMTDEIFFLAFMNRHLLLALQERSAFQVSQLVLDELDPEYRELFVRDGILRRVHIPSWAMDAVYFRDRGRCVLCNRDLTNVITLQNEENYDHIVPLALGGANDVTNLQLLCAECNARKSAGAAMTRNTVERWF